MKLKYLSLFIGLSLIGCSSNDDPAPSNGSNPIVVVPIVGKTYFVDASIPTSGNGLTEAAAFKTCAEAAAVTIEGDIVQVKNGTYAAFQETTSGKSNGYITWKNFAGHNPLVSFDGWQGIYIKGSYVEINGFTVRGNNANVTLAAALNQGRGCNNPGGTLSSIYNGNGIYVDGRLTPSNNPTGEKYHHIVIKNCTVYDCGGGGIATIQADYITIEGCKVYNNAWYSIYANSGISMYQNFNFDNISATKNIIRNNIVYGNEMLVPWASNGCQFTDGNGIIIDDFKNLQNGSTLGSYNGKTLIENNVVYNNGGRGIHAYHSDNIDIINNTCYNNCKTPQISEGEITVIGKTSNQAQNCNVYSNIMYARTGKKVNTVTEVSNYFQKNNIFFNSTLGFDLTLGGQTADPLFINAAAGNLSLQTTSPAINTGYMLRYFPAKDILGVSRPLGTAVDCGAYEVN